MDIPCGGLPLTIAVLDEHPLCNKARSALHRAERMISTLIPKLLTQVQYSSGTNFDLRLALLEKKLTAEDFRKKLMTRESLRLAFSALLNICHTYVCTVADYLNHMRSIVRNKGLTVQNSREVESLIRELVSFQDWYTREVDLVAGIYGAQYVTMARRVCKDFPM